MWRTELPRLLTVHREQGEGGADLTSIQLGSSMPHAGTSHSTSTSRNTVNTDLRQRPKRRRSQSPGSDPPLPLTPPRRSFPPRGGPPPPAYPPPQGARRTSTRRHRFSPQSPHSKRWVLVQTRSGKTPLAHAPVGAGHWQHRQITGDDFFLVQQKPGRRGAAAGLGPSEPAGSEEALDRGSRGAGRRRRRGAGPGRRGGS